MSESEYRDRIELMQANLTAVEISTIQEIVNTVIPLAEARKTEEESIVRRFDPEGRGIKGSNRDFMEETRPARIALLEYLKGLPQEQLAQVAAIMYVGRAALDQTGIPNFRDMVGWLKNTPGLAEQMQEKRPLSDYLLKGMELFNL